MAFEIVRNDITRMKVDAIVNTANPRPIIGSGTDHAIHEKAGPELLRARKQIGHITCGESAITPAFRLDAKYVIHTVSPVWVDGQHQEEELLYQAYKSALDLAHEYHCKSIAFPLMAAGSYGCPRDKAMSVAVRACNDFLMNHRMHIYLVVFNSKAFQLSQQLVADVKSYIDQHYVDERSQVEYSGGNYRRRQELEMLEESSCEEVCMSDMQLLPTGAPTFSHKSLKERLKDQQETFAEELNRILNEKNLRDSDVYNSIKMPRSTFNRIINSKTTRPKRDTALKLAFVLHLNLDQTQDFIGKAGYILSQSTYFDLVLRYCLENDIYDFFKIDDLLVQVGEKALFSIA